MRIDVRHVIKRFGAFAALDNVDLQIKSGELITLLGPSGSGKTTLLRIIAGLEWPDEGQVLFDADDALKRSIGERNVGFVFQHYALFRHLTVFENIAFGLRVRPRGARLPEAKIRERVHSLLDLVQLGWLADRYPSQLSGGQKQRVALARALAIEPRVLLLDEPFGALDAKVRKELRLWLRNLHKEIHVTSVFVTHDQEEALDVADRVVVMDKGHIVQVGTPQEIYETPNSAFVHGFIGESIRLPVSVQAGIVNFEGRALGLDSNGVPDGSAALFMRPYDVEISGPDAASLYGNVRAIRGLGPTRRAEILLDEGKHTIEIEMPRHLAIEPGQPIAIKPRRFRIFPAT